MIRDLSNAEIMLVAGMGGDEIVVTARKRPKMQPSFNRESGGGAFSTGIGAGAGNPTPADPGEEAEVVVTAAVNVKVNDSSHLAAATLAAQNLAGAIIYVREQLTAADPNQVITWTNAAGTHNMSAKKVLETLDNTKFVITDQEYDKVNGGTGSAQRGVNGAPNIDTLDYRYYDGLEQKDKDGKVLSDYAHPNYTNGQGLTGILLHEIAHLTAPGDTFYTQMMEAYRMAHKNSYDGFYDSAASRNGERFMNDMMKAIADSVKADISTFNPTYGYNAESPSKYRGTTPRPGL